MACVYFFLPSLAPHTKIIWLQCGPGLASFLCWGCLYHEPLCPHIVGAVVLTRGRFCPPRDVWQCLKTFWVSTQEWGCHWHREGRGQGCCQHPATRGRPPPLHYTAHSINSAEFKTPDAHHFRDQHYQRSALLCARLYGAVGFRSCPQGFVV